MKKLFAAIAVTIGLAACGDNSNPSGTPSSDSSTGSMSVPDTTNNSNMSVGPPDSSVHAPGGDTSGKAH